MSQDGERLWLTESQQAMWRCWLEASRLLDASLNRQLVRDSGITLPEYDILVHLSEHPGHRMRMALLAQRVVTSRSRLTHTVARLAERGWVRRESCDDDGRGVWCQLTEAGYAAIEQAAPGHARAVRAAMFEPLDYADVAQLTRLLTLVRDRITQVATVDESR